MTEFQTVTLVTAIAGIGGTGLGGIIGALCKSDSNRTVSLLLNFAAGVMLSIVCFDLIIGAIETRVGINTVVFGIVAGVSIVYFLNYVIDKNTNKEVPHTQNNHPKTADDLDELIHSDHLSEHMKKNDSKVSLFVAGIVMASAIALHNVPEGMTIGASAVNSNDILGGSSLILAVLIGLHNIPEGMAVSVPLISGGLSKGKAIIITASTGIPTVVGAWFGYVIGDISPIGLALSLSFASGAMLYVVFGEILPQAILMYRSKLPTFALILGMIIGMLIIYG